MRLMLIHADSFRFSVTDKTKVAAAGGELSDADKGGEVKEVLVAFTAVESGDEKGVDSVSLKAAKEISAAAKKVGAERVMVYPYAHLSSDLSKPRVAASALKKIVEQLNEFKLEVHSAPFGYYKSYEISCKGHPLSELSFTITPSDDDKAPKKEENAAIAAEKKLKSEWRVYSPDGSYVAADKFDYSAHPDLKELMFYEKEGTRQVSEAPLHIKVMRDHELVDHEPASDTGNLRWYPKGLLMKRLLERHVTNLSSQYGAMEVETPIMYDYNHPALCKYLQRFPARQYVVKSDDKELFLRFAACFGQYMIKHDMFASYRNLPICLYELTHYSFRREQSGEVAGLRRLRAFTMPDMHTVARDTEMAKQSFVEQIKVCLNWLKDLELSCVPVIRFVKSFLDENPEIITLIMQTLNRPAIVEVWDQRFFYFVAKFEMNFIDTSKKAACLSTVQIDVENAERFDISFVEEDGSKKRPLILHASVSGSIDRNVYALLERQVMRMEAGQKPFFPTWLAPVQVRILPVSETHIPFAEALAAKIPFRTDIDDRSLKIGKKIREAEQEWIPYVIVVGDKEAASETIPVRPRLGEQESLTPEELTRRLAEETTGKPFLPLNTPRLLSKRPSFV